MMTTDPVCAVCGMGGHWVGWSPRYGEHRCLNHLDDDAEPTSYFLDCGCESTARDHTCGVAS